MWFLRILLLIVLAVLLLDFSLANVALRLPEVVLLAAGPSRLAIGNVSFVLVALAAFFGGVLLTLFACLGRDLGARRELRRARDERARLAAELAAIRHLPLEEPLPPAVYRDAGDRE